MPGRDWFTRFRRSETREFICSWDLWCSSLGWLNLDTVRWSVLVLTIGGVLAAETINTTVEAIVDLLSPEWHAQAKVAKDVAAAGVLILSLTAIVIGLLILGPPLCHRLLELQNKV